MIPSRIENIYREGARLFSRNGYEGTSLRDVANACGMSMAAIHYHFATKEELHDEITQFCFEEFIGNIAAGQKKLAPGQGKPSTLIASIFDAVFANPTLFNLMQHDLQYLNEDRRRARSRERYSAFVALIGDTMRRCWGREPDETAAFAAGALIAGYCELVQADERSTGTEKEQFILRHRTTLIRIVEQLFDQPNS